MVLLTAMAFGQDSMVKTKVRAGLYDRDLNLKPVPNLTVSLVASEAPAKAPITVQTNLDGIAEVELPPGKYRVTTEKAVEFFDKSFLWDLEADLSRPENTVELSNANAKATPLAGGRNAHIDELAYQYKRVKGTVITVWTDRGAFDGIVLDPAGLVLTTYSPVEKATWLAVQFDDDRRVSAAVVVSNKENDLAVLRVNTTEAGVIVPADLSTDPGALVEGERVFVVGNPGGDAKKKLITGVLSNADQKEIISDVKLTYPGAALFNSSGAVIGIVQWSQDKLQTRPIAAARPLLQEARQKLSAGAPPPSHLLPTPPVDDFPSDQLRAPGRGAWERDVYSFKAGDFSIEFVDPISSYETDTERYDQAMKDYAKHPKNKTEPTEPEHKYRPVLIIVAVPQTKTSWGKTILAGMAAGPYSTGVPTFKHYKTGFKEMRVLCGEKEVPPIWPRRFAAGSVANYSVIVEDEAFSGQYYYAHNAISPQCGKVTLQLFSTSDPDHPFEKVLDDKIIARIWSDFEPYRRTLKSALAQEPGK
jgi:S1-C subfamily serine protease